MDFISHGLWGSIAFGRDTKKYFWYSFLFGMGPDLLSFGIFSFASLVNVVRGISHMEFGGPPPIETIPSYVFTLYDITHSLLIFALVFAFVWYIRKKPYLPLLAWGLHIFFDIFTHSREFFPTPFLWPISDITFDGISWGTPWIFATNVFLIVFLYTVWGITSFLQNRDRQN